MTGRVLFHVQHLLGIGHLQRTRRIAEALAAAGQHVTLVQGGPPVAELGAAPGIDIVRLPAIRARDASFALVNEKGGPVDDALRAARRERLLAAFRAVRPGVVAIEGFPFARRAFRFELDPLIDAARRAGVPVVCSVRDIPTVRPEPARLAEIAGRVNADFAAVLVHGDPSFIPFDVAFPAVAAIARRMHYTGYIAGPALRSAEPEAPSGEVIVSAGGGAAGRSLLDAALAARRDGWFADRGWRILAGAGRSAAELAALQDAAPPGVTIEGFRADLPALLRHCHVSVSQAGYNTVLDIVAAKVRAVLVPFAAERETEQTIRAEHLAVRGAAVLLREHELTAAALGAAIARAARTEPAPLRLDTGGAGRAAALIAGLAAG